MPKKKTSKNPKSPKRKVAKKKRAPKKSAADSPTRKKSTSVPKTVDTKPGRKDGHTATHSKKTTLAGKPPVAPADAKSVDHDLSVDLPVPGGGDGNSPLVESQIRTLVTALNKQQRGEALGREETRIVTKWQKQQEERLRKEYYASIPQKHWLEMSGRPAKIINEQARLYGIPFDGATVCLGDVVKAMHDMFADRTLQRTVSTDPDDPDGLFMGTGGGDSHWMEQCRKEKAKILRLQRQEKEKNLIPRETIRESLNQMAQLLRDAGIRVQKKYGPDAYEIIKQANDGFQMQIHHALGNNESNS